MKCWRQLLGNKPSVVPKHFSGFPGLGQAELRLMMTNAPVAQCPVQKGIVQKEFVPPGQTVNAAFYVEVLKRLRENVRRKWPDQRQNNTWLLHHDNVPAHAALLAWRFLTDNNMTVVSHPPYSPDLAPSDFFLFPKLKWSLKGEDFRWRIFKQSRRPSWTRYKKMTSKNASKTGSATAIYVKP